ncbi:PAC2 family protein [Propioniciclava tarda]|uniref:PAC2 family protein n=1 Tax=Propioniciclava tarda TaxID=433330 RepID=A0A4Q9KMX2_PROTD|nr:PAC2 family protein [Propioniciclava tarda]TBT95888.1 PAC2 family protein [Propioniciclava tarda]SMO41057.1 Predicted ATP-dependent carboligase, ATP-grasp superfamily [Propioniciclava tarda]HOA89313.1 PAC2 family protein [Propioniciclava tarda]HQA30678.1 PAC2 family protein [Propioniciclava tarda]HQD60620.1 PAC2 family protein [Propioniciclava tarda]
MSGPSPLRDLNRPVVIAAFGGWNDAGDAATGVLDHLADLSSAELAFALDPDEFYDFTSSRPVVINGDDGRRIIEWPTVEVLVGHLPERDLVLIGGPEPNYHWSAFCAKLVSAMMSVKPEHVILLGSMLADAPHRRPVQIAMNSTEYEGPTGIVGVLTQACNNAGFEVTTLWAAVPHYVAEPPNPKATLALLGQVEDVLDATLEVRDLPQQAAAWEGRVNDLAADDPDIQTYISTLEEHYDTDEETDVAEALAAEAERFLRRRNR